MIKLNDPFSNVKLNISPRNNLNAVIKSAFLLAGDIDLGKVLPCFSNIAIDRSQRLNRR